MSDTFNHQLDALESYLNDMDEGFGPSYESYAEYIPPKKSKNVQQETIPKKILVTHFGKNLISEMTQAHLENSIKFVISKNTVLDDYKKELIKVMTNRVNELKTKQPTTSFTIIDNKTGEVIFEC